MSGFFFEKMVSLAPYFSHSVLKLPVVTYAGGCLLHQGDPGTPKTSHLKLKRLTGSRLNILSTKESFGDE